MDEICPKCKRPMNMGNSPNPGECTETDDEDGLCEAHETIYNLRAELATAQHHLGEIPCLQRALDGAIKTRSMYQESDESFEQRVRAIAKGCR